MDIRVQKVLNSPLEIGKDGRQFDFQISDLSMNHENRRFVIVAENPAVPNGKKFFSKPFWVVYVVCHHKRGESIDSMLM